MLLLVLGVLSRVWVHARFIFQRLLLPPLLFLGHSTCPPLMMIWVKRKSKMMSRLNMLVKVVRVMQVVMVEVKVLRLRLSLVRLHLAIPSIPGVHRVLDVVLLRGYPGVLNLKTFELGPGIPITQHVMIYRMLLGGN
ncbi:hypothetical protein HanRHA438_Chr16g0760521 [Helianthus annuus]|nr:hypothetical protein HanLR1_Chr16g0621181 [Helianthus annuus]KAJ0644836.1 hypothetical protein HanOQP8_Chr16g0616841 [Helianthus annuus]KAJ0821238.1 hypothetical protein HanPSC8_Chr16g0717661 [Helianthus annuus]KAJ0835890.1 hypothetical protein HanRHA438_Chr16g0760521 [Helianthus annuus]